MQMNGNAAFPPPPPHTFLTTFLLRAAGRRDASVWHSDNEEKQTRIWDRFVLFFSPSLLSLLVFSLPSIRGAAQTRRPYGQEGRMRGGGRKGKADVCSPAFPTTLLRHGNQTPSLVSSLAPMGTLKSRLRTTPSLSLLTHSPLSPALSPPFSRCRSF